MIKCLTRGAHTLNDAQTTTKTHTTFDFIEKGKGFFFFRLCVSSFLSDVLFIEKSYAFFVSCRGITAQNGRSSSVYGVIKCTLNIQSFGASVYSI